MATVSPMMCLPLLPTPCLLLPATAHSLPAAAHSLPAAACRLLQVLNIEQRKPMTPRIDVYDHSGGKNAPAYAISPAVRSLGSEYLFVGLGGGFIGVYSLATGVGVGAGRLLRGLGVRVP